MAPNGRLCDHKAGMLLISPSPPHSHLSTDSICHEEAGHQSSRSDPLCDGQQCACTSPLLCEEECRIFWSPPTCEWAPSALEDQLKSSIAKTVVSSSRYLPAFWLSRSATPLSFLQQRGSPQSAIDPGRHSVTPGYLFTLALLELSISPSKYSGSQWVSERWRTVRGLDIIFLFEMRLIIRFSSSLKQLPTVFLQWGSI